MTKATHETIYTVCSEHGIVLFEYFNQDDAMERCNWQNGETVSYIVKPKQNNRKEKK